MRDNIFSIDVEDWFNLSGTGAEPPPSKWDRLESRLERNFHGLLELLAEGGGTATCFVVGYFGKRFPQLIREAVAAGHEIAAHGYFHRLIYDMSPAEFYEDALATRKLLEDISGAAVRGFRAPAFSVTERTPWFFEKLVEAGYEYDFSVFPHFTKPAALPVGVRALHGADGGRRACGISRSRPCGAWPTDVFFRRRFFAIVSVSGHPRHGAQSAKRRPPDHLLCASTRDRSRTAAHGIEPPPPFHLLREPQTTRPKIRHILRDFPVTSFDKFLAQRAMP